MSGRVRASAVVASLLVAAALVIFLRPWGSAESASTAPVLREDFRASVTATGKLEAEVAFEIGPPSVRDFWEYNLTWLIGEGSRVEEGAVVARFDTTQIDDRLREHRAEHEKVSQEREKEERNLDIALRRLRLNQVKAESELEKLALDLSVPEGVVAPLELAEARLEKALASRRVDFLREKIDFEKKLVATKLQLLDVKREFAEQKIAYNEEVKAKFSVSAPTAGIVLNVPKRGGDPWEVGESVWMLAKILKVADVSTLRIEAQVLEADAAKIAAGQPVEVTVDAIPGMTIKSEVGELGRMVHERSVQDPSKVFDVYVPLGDVDGELLRPGMSVQVTIETSRLEGRLTVPIEAVRMADQGPTIDVVGAAGGRETRAVELGPRNRERVVIESGLAEGERVALMTPGTT